MGQEAIINLTDEQEAYARRLVAHGRYASISDVARDGIDLLRERDEIDEALRTLLQVRRSGAFVSSDESLKSTCEMIARKRTERGL